MIYIWHSLRTIAVVRFINARCRRCALNKFPRRKCHGNDRRNNNNNKNQLNWMKSSRMCCELSFMSLLDFHQPVYSYPRSHCCNNLPSVCRRADTHWLWIIPSMHIAIPFHISWEYSKIRPSLSLPSDSPSRENYFEYDARLKSLCRTVGITVSHWRKEKGLSQRDALNRNWMQRAKRRPSKETFLNGYKFCDGFPLEAKNK